MSWVEDALKSLASLAGQAPAAPPQNVEKDFPAAEPQPPKSLPFYPSDRHIKYNQAPEKSLTYDDVEAIAKARRQAEEAGVLTPELGEHLLPIAMTEGWGGKMGVVGGGKGFYASQRFRSALDKMGLEEGKDYSSYFMKGEKYISPIEGSPAMAAVILGEKAKLKQAGGTLEGAVKSYNGKGKAMEEYDGKLVPADVDVYWKKVSEAARLLQHPLNAGLVKHFNSVYQQ